METLNRLEEVKVKGEKPEIDIIIREIIIFKNPFQGALPHEIEENKRKEKEKIEKLEKERGNWWSNHSSNLNLNFKKITDNNNNNDNSNSNSNDSNNNNNNHSKGILNAKRVGRYLNQNVTFQKSGGGLLNLPKVKHDNDHKLLKKQKLNQTGVFRFTDFQKKDDKKTVSNKE